MYYLRLKKDGVHFGILYQPDLNFTKKINPGDHHVGAFESVTSLVSKDNSTVINLGWSDYSNGPPKTSWRCEFIPCITTGSLTVRPSKTSTKTPSYGEMHLSNRHWGIVLSGIGVWSCVSKYSIWWMMACDIITIHSTDCSFSNENGHPWKAPFTYETSHFSLNHPIGD